MIHMPHVHSNISVANLGVINSQFYSFLRLCSCKEFLVSDGQSYRPSENSRPPLKDSERGLEGCSIRKNCKPTWTLLFTAILFCV